MSDDAIPRPGRASDDTLADGPAAERAPIELSTSPDPSGELDIFPDLSGQEINGMRVTSLLGRGGMGEVYKAWDQQLERYVAVKIVLPFYAQDAAFSTRFEREARAAATISHPNLAHVYSTGRWKGRPYYVMEFIEGRSLADMLRREGKISGSKCIEYLAQACEGLRAAQEKGIVHRDIKPDNLMVDQRDHLKIVDFGLARRQNDDVALTQPSLVIGTPRYMAPEQATAGEVDHRSDIYSLGASFYHLFSGTPPFEAATPVALMMQHVTDPLPPLRERNPRVPAAVAAVIEKMLAKDAANRYQSYEALLADIQRAKSGAVPAQPLARRGLPAGRQFDVRSAATTQAAAEGGKAAKAGLLVGGGIAVIVIGLLIAILNAPVPDDEPKPAAEAVDAESAESTDAAGKGAQTAPTGGFPFFPGGGAQGGGPAGMDMTSYMNMAKRATTQANLRKLMMGIEVHFANTGAMPATMQDILESTGGGEPDTKDGWGRAIEYETTGMRQYRLVSAGADGTPGSADDIVLENGYIVGGELPGATPTN